MREAGDTMKVLVAGATGTIGVPPVRTLVAGGHHVYGLIRDPGKRQLLTALKKPPAGHRDMARTNALRTAGTAGTAGPTGRWRHHVLDLHRRCRRGHRGRPGARPGWAMPTTWSTTSRCAGASHKVPRTPLPHQNHEVRPTDEPCQHSTSPSGSARERDGRA